MAGICAISGARSLPNAVARTRFSVADEQPERFAFADESGRPYAAWPESQQEAASVEVSSWPVRRPQSQRSRDIEDRGHHAGTGHL